jgi:hypothetical protein
VVRQRESGTHCLQFLWPFLWFIFLIGLPHRILAFESSFWVWHRPAPLTTDEVYELQRQQVTRLYWEVGEVAFEGGRWTWISQPVPRAARNSSSLHVIPVVQIVPDEKFVSSPGDLIALLKSVAESGELQIDCDCPDRLLYRYGEFLGQLHREVPKLSFTALAHWIRHPGWKALEENAVEVLPMFYDLYPDPSNTSESSPPFPLLKPAESQMESWQGCRIPWQAGLPTFVRVTLYDSNGRSRGHIRDWSWNEICFQKALRPLGSVPLGGTLFAVDENLRLNLTLLPKGSLLAVRCADRGAIVEATAAVRRFGAQGVVYFRMPDGSDPSGWSLRQVGQFLKGDPFTPKLSVRMNEGQQLELANISDSDLPPRLLDEAGTGDRAYALEIDADAPIFREAEAGEFWRVAAHATPDTNPRPTGIPLATRLTFWFSHLRAGEVLRSGLIQLVPGTKPEKLRYRVLGTGEDLSWRKFD